MRQNPHIINCVPDACGSLPPTSTIYVYPEPPRERNAIIVTSPPPTVGNLHSWTRPLLHGSGSSELGPSRTLIAVEGKAKLICTYDVGGRHLFSFVFSFADC